MIARENVLPRPLTPADLEPVIDLDAELTGRKRRMFFEKRLQAALGDPQGFVAKAVDNQEGQMVGFAIARIQNGEFGENHRVAVLDVIGVDPDDRHIGAGTVLLQSIADDLKKMGIDELRTQVDWQDSGLTHFFASAGFELAFDQVLERPVVGDNLQ